MTSIGTIGFIGGGNMAEALLRGLLLGAVPAEGLLVAEPHDERRQYLRERYGIGVVAGNGEVVARCDLVVLAVKPQVAAQVLDELAAGWSDAKRLVSILAGVGTAQLEDGLPGAARVVRAMPNLPAVVGEGATALCRGRHATPADLTLARHLFESVGTVQVVSEGQMDTVTGLSGSGPAYVFTLIEALADGGVLEGLPRETALALAVQTVLGAAKLAREGGEHPAQLRDKVCSPGGTTIAGVRALEQHGLRAALIEAVAAATRRSRELGGKK